MLLAHLTARPACDRTAGTVGLAGPVWIQRPPAFNVDRLWVKPDEAAWQPRCFRSSLRHSERRGAHHSEPRLHRMARRAQVIRVWEAPGLHRGSGVRE